MNTTTAVAIESRILSEGYGPGAWHGPDLKAALADVDPALAFWRPAKERHNIAELVLHHAFFIRAVRSQIAGVPAEPFVLQGADWFASNDERAIPWPKIQSTLESQQKRLVELIAAVEAGTATSPLPAAERLNLVLGITCHAVYHAGQIQLIKRLKA